MTGLRWAGVLATGLLFLRAAPLGAHPINVAYADIEVSAARIDIDLSLNLFELDLLLSLDRNQDALVDPQELEAGRPAILDYLRQRVGVQADGAELPLEAGPFRVGQGPDGKALFQSRLGFRAAHPLSRFVVRCEPLTDLGPDHRTLGTIRAGESVKQFVFEKGLRYEGGRGNIVAAVVQFLRFGVAHIFTGADHVLFLLGLLLVGGSFSDVVKIVTAFTLAHSVTLSLAVLGVLTPPARLVEAGIAASIVYIAADNLLFRRFDRRWLVSFFFGLVHGFGFASVLQAMRLSRSELLSSLVSFNVGVEVGQVVIVLVLLPILWSLARTRVHVFVVNSASVVILSAGLFWFYQRVF